MSDPFGLQEKNFVIMGGSSGLGISAARALHEQGARLVLVGRNAATLEEASAQLGSDVLTLAGDAKDSVTSEKAIAEAVSTWGRLDGLYHVAGGSGRSHGDGPLHELSDEGLDFTLQLNLGGLMKSNRAAIQQFLRQESGGVILNMGSVLGAFPSPRYFASHAYAAAKAAIEGYSRSIASYYADRNIRVNVIAPALVATPMSKRAQGNEEILEFIASKQPLNGGRIGVPEDLDQAVLYLLGSRSRFTTGQVLRIDGGWSVSEGQIPQE